MFHLYFFFVKFLGCKDCHFGQFGTITARHISRYKRVSGDLIRPRSRSKSVKGILFGIIDVLLGAKFVTLYLTWRVGG